jgi:hypothetical protein
MGEVVGAELGVIGQEDAAPGSGDERGLHRGLRTVRGGQAALEREAVRAQEGDIHEDSAQVLQSGVVDSGLSPAADPAAHEMDGQLLAAGQQRGDRQAVGHDGELAVGREDLGEAERGGSRVQGDRALLGQERQRSLGDV